MVFLTYTPIKELTQQQETRRKEKKKTLLDGGIDIRISPNTTQKCTNLRAQSFIFLPNTLTLVPIEILSTSAS